MVMNLPLFPSPASKLQVPNLFVCEEWYSHEMMTTSHIKYPDLSSVQFRKWKRESLSILCASFLFQITNLLFLFMCNQDFVMKMDAVMMHTMKRGMDMSGLKIFVCYACDGVRDSEGLVTSCFSFGSI